MTAADTTPCTVKGIIVSLVLLVLVATGSPVSATLTTSDYIILDGVKHSPGDEIVSERGRAHRVYYKGAGNYEAEFVGSPEFTRSVVDGSWVEYGFTDYGDYYAVQHPWSSVAFYDYYTEVWNEEFTEVKIYDDRWAAEYLNKQDRWTDTGFWNVIRSYEIVSDGIKLYRTGSTDIGQRTEEYYFENGSPCKITISQTCNDAQNIRFVWKPSGIVAATEKHLKKDSLDPTSETVGLNYYNANGKFVETIRWYDALDTTDAIDIVTEASAQGRKATVTFGGFAINAGGIAHLDPTTFYPDADPETSSVDGALRHAELDLTWADIRTAAGDYADDAAEVVERPIIQADNSANLWNALGRGGFLFDTSSLPDAAIITAATLSFYGSTKLDQCSITPSTNVYSFLPDDNTWLDADDYLYTKFGTTPFCDTSITYANWKVADPFWNDFAFNDDGLAAISKTGVSKFGTREAKYDVTGDAPAHPGSQLVSYVGCYASEKGTGFKPKLVVTFTAIGSPTIVTNAAQNVEETTATLSANVTAINNGSIDARGFEWDTDSGPPYSSNWTENGSWGIGEFTHGITGLTEGKLYYYRGFASNNESADWGYGNELYFVTKPQVPTTLTDTARTNAQITLTWTKGAGSENTTIVYKTTDYSANYTDGTSGYSGTASTCNITGLSPSIQYYISAWAVNTDNTTIYSDSSAQVIAWTRPSDATNANTSNPDYTTLDLDWTKGASSNKTHWRWDTTDFPADVASGTQAYFGTANSTTVTSLPTGTLIYFNAWAYSDNSTYYSSGNISATGTTLAVVVPTVTTSNATDISSSGTTLSGNITATGGENASVRGAEWGIASGNYTDNQTSAGSFSTGVFSEIISGLSTNTTYYFRALAVNGAGAGYGTELSFTTSAVPIIPDPPINFTITQVDTNSVNITWTKGTSATLTIIRVSTERYPTSPTDGYGTYNGTGTSVIDDGLSLTLQTYYYRAWSWTNPYSDEYAEGSIGGENMLIIALSLLTIALTLAAFWRKDAPLHLVCVIMWLFMAFYLANVAYPAGNDYLAYAATGVCLSMVLVMAMKTLQVYFSGRPKPPTSKEVQAEHRRKVIGLTKKKKTPWWEE